MQRVKRQPVRNKIDLSDASQVRAWTKRLDTNADGLKEIVNMLGDSVATVSKEIELQAVGSPAAGSCPRRRTLKATIAGASLTAMTALPFSNSMGLPPNFTDITTCRTNSRSAQLPDGQKHALEAGELVKSSDLKAALRQSLRQSV